MNKKNLQDVFDNMKPDQAQKDKMLQNILTRKKNNKGFVIALVACSLILVVVLMPPKVVDRPDDFNRPISDQPMPQQRYVNYNGSRYICISQESVNDNKIKLTKKLGTDFASNFASDGIIYEIQNYSSEDRIAVKLNNIIFICQNINKKDKQ